MCSGLRPLRPAGFIPARPYQSECAAGGRYGALETALEPTGRRSDRNSGGVGLDTTTYRRDPPLPRPVVLDPHRSQVPPPQVAHVIAAVLRGQVHERDQVHRVGQRDHNTGTIQ